VTPDLSLAERAEVEDVRPVERPKRQPARLTPAGEDYAIRYARLADALRRVRAADAVLAAVAGDPMLRAIYLGELRLAVRDVRGCGDRVATEGARNVLRRWQEEAAT